jgi:hypothetical protein
MLVTAEMIEELMPRQGPARVSRPTIVTSVGLDDAWVERAATAVLRFKLENGLAGAAPDDKKDQ